MTVVPPEPRADQLLGQRYQLVRRIATGGMGQVWEAFDTVLHRPVAVKVLRDELVEEPGFLDRFRDEARHTAGLSHPGIATAYDYGEERTDNGIVAYMVMELVDGEPLSAILARRGRLPADEATRYLVQIAHALDAAHQRGVVHRDVKPGNILVRPDGSVKVTDFGVAHVVDSARVTAAGHVVGTATYLSPEQATGGPASAASDVYSLGVVGYEMVTGQPPFAVDNPAALALAHATQPAPALPSTLPAPLRSTIAAALSKDPRDRPVDANAFADELTGQATHVMPAVQQTAVMPLPPPVLLHRRPRWITWTTIALLLVFAAVAVWAARGANDGIDPQVPPTSVVPVSTTVPPNVAAPTTTAAAVSAPAPTTPAKAKGKHKGHGNG